MTHQQAVHELGRVFFYHYRPSYSGFLYYHSNLEMVYLDLARLVR